MVNDIFLTSSDKASSRRHPWRGLKGIAPLLGWVVTYLGIAAGLALGSAVALSSGHPALGIGVYALAVGWVVVFFLGGKKARAQA